MFFLQDIQSFFNAVPKSQNLENIRNGSMSVSNNSLNISNNSMNISNNSGNIAIPSFASIQNRPAASRWVDKQCFSLASR
jgi:hypothetical protein